MRWLLNDGPIVSGGLWLNPPRGSAPPADPFAALYGTGLGQVPLHLRPEDAVLDGSGNVMSVPNKGGAGAAFTAAASAMGITRTGNQLSVPAAGAYLTLANPANLSGSRLFMVAALAADTGNINFAGRSDGAADGQRNNLRWESASIRFNLQRWDGTAFRSHLLQRGTALGTALHLIEIEIAAGTARLFVDGVTNGTAAFTAPDYFLNRIFAGHATPYFTGTAGDVVSLVTDGSAAMDAPVATIRNALATKYGITLS